MKVLIEVECSNAAFDDYPENELRRILNTVPRKVIRQLSRQAGCVCQHPEADDKLLDANGNTVGTLKVIE